MTDEEQLVDMLEMIEQRMHGIGPRFAPQTAEALMAPVYGPDENPRLEFRDGQMLFRMATAAGGLVERFISDAAAREAFSGIPIDSGWLRTEVVRWGDGKHGEWAIAFVPPQVHELEITSEHAVEVTAETPAGAKPEPVFRLDRLKVPLPGLVFFGLGMNYFCWAVTTPGLDPYHEIYRAPLPNIYSDGRICWGLVKPPRATARTIFDAIELFMKSTFNNHLASGKSKAHSAGAADDVRALLRDCAVEQASPLNPLPCEYPFPVNDLVRQIDRVGITLDKAIREFFQTGVMPE